jgi:hypothetical protein
VNPVSKQNVGDSKGQHSVEYEFNRVDELGGDPDWLSELMMQFMYFLV